MIAIELSFGLPPPWTQEQFTANTIGPINYLVGPNGTGKSQFAEALRDALSIQGFSTRLLGTDRLAGMVRQGTHGRLGGSLVDEGYPKQRFNNFKRAGQSGSGLDTMVLLEERLDLRIRLEATLASLFDRELRLDWDSGTMIPRGRRASGGDMYRLDQEECHGIKEILVLLTHLYDNTSQCLIIDEPELNLHPQYQAFFMQEVRRVAGNPRQSDRKKIIFLVTHSPFMLDFRRADDVLSLISFESDLRPPKQVRQYVDESTIDLPFVQALNLEGKQIFFSNNPLFVEGRFDAQFIGALLEARGFSIAGAGSCLIDAGGREEVSKYLRLCKGMEKRAHFVYDLDALFAGQLRRSMKDDSSLGGLLAEAGLGPDFVQYCGQLDRLLAKAADMIIGAMPSGKTAKLFEYLQEEKGEDGWSKEPLSRARTAVVIAIDRYREEMLNHLGTTLLDDIIGRRQKVLQLLADRQVHVLPGGALEHYLPCYQGDEYNVSNTRKAQAIQEELSVLATSPDDESLRQRYRELFEIANLLPGVPAVDWTEHAKGPLRDYIYALQRLVSTTPTIDPSVLREKLLQDTPARSKFFSLRDFHSKADGTFRATVVLESALLGEEMWIEIGDRTNPGSDDLILVPAPKGVR